MTEERKCPYCPAVKYPGGCPPCAEFIAEHEAMEARVKELEAENAQLKAVDHFQPIEAAGVFIKRALVGLAELNNIQVDEKDFGIQYFCPHCGQKSPNKETMLSHDAECFRHPAVIRAEQLKSELDHAKAAAVNWVTYDGTPETLPEKTEMVLIYGGVAVLSDRRGHSLVWDFDDRAAVKVQTGDRWAYLPTPGNKEDF